MPELYKKVANRNSRLCFHPIATVCEILTRTPRKTGRKVLRHPPKKRHRMTLGDDAQLGVDHGPDAIAGDFAATESTERTVHAPKHPHE